MKNILILVSICILSSVVSDTAIAATCAVHCPDGSRPIQDCESTHDPCGGGYTPPTRDYEAERRQQEAAAAEAAAEAERQRQAEERRIKEAAEKQAAFIRERDGVKLKGSIGTSISPNDGGPQG